MILFALTSLFASIAGLLVYVGVVDERKQAEKFWSTVDLSPEARVMLRAAGYPVP